MERYEARYDDELGNMVWDTETNAFLTVDEIAERLNAHAGMKTREEVEKQIEEYSKVRDLP